MVRWLEATEYPGQRNAVYVARREGRLVAYCFAFTEEESFHISEVAYDEDEQSSIATRRKEHAQSTPLRLRKADVAGDQ